MSYSDNYDAYTGKKITGRTKLGRFLKAGGNQLARQGARAGRYGVESSSRRAIGLTPSEYAELRRLRETKRIRELTGNEGYITEMVRLKELERRYKGELRSGQARKAGRYAYERTRRFLTQPPKRVRA